MRILLGFIVLVILLAPAAGAPIYADDIPDNCENSRAAYYQPNIFPRYELHNRRLALISWTTGETVSEIETSLETDFFQFEGWSPDCRYLSARVGGAGLVVWDVPNHQRVGVFDNTRHYANAFTRKESPILWNSNSTYAVVEGNRGATVFNPTTGNQFWIDSDYTFNYVAWSPTHGLLFTVRYDTSSLVNVYDLNSGDFITTLDREIFVSGLVVSPDEHYLLVGGYHYTEVWDLQTFRANQEVYLRLAGSGRIRFLSNTQIDIIRGEWWFRVFRYDLSSGSGRTIFYDGEQPYKWDPSNKYAITQYDDGLYLWQEDTQQRIFLADRKRLFYREPYWDLAHGRMYLVVRGILSYDISDGHIFHEASDRSLDDGVYAYDLNTGARVGWYPLNGHHGPPQFVFSPDASKIAVFTNEEFSWRPPEGVTSGLVVWDQAAQTGVEVNVEGYAVGHTGQIAFSPDNRYLVIGIEALRVWDLQNLPQNAGDRLPTYRYDGPEATVSSLRFVDNQTIETTSDAGVQRWDVTSGALISG